ncbi:MAG: gliding motility-associated C-terminal domain-containing protein [Cyclobacteriaceae bacterium]
MSRCGNILLVAVLVSISHELAAQQINTSCAIGENLTPAQRQVQAAAFNAWKASQFTNSAASRTAEAKYTVPVVFHLIEGAPSISDDDIEVALASLNNAFAHSGHNPLGQDFSMSIYGVDTELEFCLAQRAPDGGATNGITRIVSKYNNFDVDLETAKLKTMIQWDPTDYVNIWVVDFIYSELIATYTGRTWWARAGLGGFATLPGDTIRTGDFADGVVVAGLSPELLAHEMGHYLGLLHTWQGGCKNDDCLVDGDMVCDTPPDSSTEFSCGDNSCNTDTLSNFSNNTFFTDTTDMGTNFMDYGNGECSNDFSQGQAERMQFHLEQYRIALFLQSDDSLNVCSAPCNNNLSTDFSFDNLYPIPNVPLNFTSSADSSANYEWYVERLGPTTANYSVGWLTGDQPSDSVPVATTPDLTYSFPEVGKYRVYLRAYRSDDPTCFTSTTEIVRVTCGVDARFYPDKRIIASKQPKALLFDSVTFTNISENATDYQWTITHSSYNSSPNLPEFTSDVVDLTYKFTEPGDYSITLQASAGDCVDETRTFLLPVVDPTIDGIPAIESIFCHNDDSVLVNFRIFNPGYDTVNVGMPVSFYTSEPRESSPQPILLKTYRLPRIVYGVDSERFSTHVPGIDAFDPLFIVFNDTGKTEFPISFPSPDLNVYSFDTEFPPSGYAELSYQNNVASFVNVEEFLDLPDIWTCEDEFINLEVDDRWVDATWRSASRGLLGTGNPLTYQVGAEDTIYVSTNSRIGCVAQDSFLINISRPEVVTPDSVYRIVRGESVRLGASGGVSYLWEPPDGLDNPASATPNASPFSTTDYTVQMMDSIGCIDMTTVRVYVETTAHIPSLFTPNGDGQNERLLVYGLEDVASFSLRIFNRLGNLVYETESPENVSVQGWDGTWKGQEQPSGPYFWQVTGRYNNGKEMLLNGEKTGVSHLLR